MEAAGIEVTIGILEKKSLELNKRFFTFHNKKRPYIILKWAQTQDGFIDVERSDKIFNNKKVDNWITTPASKKLVHQWRAEEQSIMVGTNTALNDNPSLTVREVEGNNPIRIVLDMDLKLPENLHLFDKAVPTLVFNQLKNEASTNLDFVKINTDKNLITQILQELYNREIQSIIIEGGAQLLNSFITQNLWDEARVFTGKKEFKKGLEAPKIDQSPKLTTQIDSDILNTYFNA
jgi:diaminohydroxyphosphoribosylaminopyrimidine deaminase/5-amino-6-(5-phosphoribosylamino)uracil reductase